MLGFVMKAVLSFVAILGFQDTLFKNASLNFFKPLSIGFLFVKSTMYLYNILILDKSSLKLLDVLIPMNHTIFP